MPLSRTKAKNRPGEEGMVVESVSSPTKTARTVVERKVRREGEV